MNFCLYTSEQEENIFIRKNAESWKRSGLIAEEQRRIMEAEADPRVRQTNLFFRILFFIFTTLAVAAMVGFSLWIVHIDTNGGIAAILIIFSIPFYFVAEFMVKEYSFYRYGIEEVLSLAAMIFLCIACSLLLRKDGLDHHSIIILVYSLLSLIAFWLYLRFGFLYAVLISITALGVMPFQLSVSATAARSLSLLILCLILLINVISDKAEIADFQKENNTIIQAALLAGIYLIVNLRLPELARLYGEQKAMDIQPHAGFPVYVYWISYLLVFLIPVAGIFWGFKSRKRLIINISFIAICLTLATNKDYLGLKHYAWDPAIMGIMLIIISTLASCWLMRGPSKSRDGFTAEPVLKPEDYGIDLIDVGAALTPSMIGSQEPVKQTDKFFEGGQSGGGGASRHF